MVMQHVFQPAAFGDTAGRNNDGQTSHEGLTPQPPVRALLLVSERPRRGLKVGPLEDLSEKERSEVTTKIHRQGATETSSHERWFDDSNGVSETKSALTETFQKTHAVELLTR